MNSLWEICNREMLHLAQGSMYLVGAIPVGAIGNRELMQ